MITDEEVKRLAVGSGFEPEAVAQHSTQIVAFDSVCDFARAIYQLGRQHQRESDAALCQSIAPSYSNDLNVASAWQAAEAIIKNT